MNQLQELIDEAKYAQKADNLYIYGDLITHEIIPFLEAIKANPDLSYREIYNNFWEEI